MICYPPKTNMTTGKSTICRCISDWWRRFSTVICWKTLSMNRHRISSSQTSKSPKPTIPIWSDVCHRFRVFLPQISGVFWAEDRKIRPWVCYSYVVRWKIWSTAWRMWVLTKILGLPGYEVLSRVVHVGQLWVSCRTTQNGHNSLKLT